MLLDARYLQAMSSGMDRVVALSLVLTRRRVSVVPQTVRFPLIVVQKQEVRIYCERNDDRYQDVHV